MYLNPRRIFPRWKEWQPLATQQLRLRSVIQIMGFNIGPEDLEGKNYNGSAIENGNAAKYYYTLHLTTMSAPFYTSETMESASPKWGELDGCEFLNADIFYGVQELVVRIWRKMQNSNCDDVITIWGINLTGLMFLGTQLSCITLPVLPNTLVFLMPGGYYCTHECDPLKSSGRLAKTITNEDNLRRSYHISLINKLSSVQKQILEKFSELQNIKKKIETGDFLTADKRGSAMLRRIMNKNKPKISQVDITRIKENLEDEKFRIEILREERNRVATRLASHRARLESICDHNQMKESRTMEEYRMLQRRFQAHRDWLTSHGEKREAQLHAKAFLNFRIKQLISKLQYIYPVVVAGRQQTICNVHLPDSEHLTDCSDVQLSVALGYVSHTVQMISIFLQVPLRYPVIHLGSRSLIVDLISDKLPDNEREFPLYSKGKDKLQFNYAVYLLNKNIAGLRWLCGLGTSDLKSTLPNLIGILQLSGTEPFAYNIRSPTTTIDSSTFTFPSPSPISVNPSHSSSALAMRHSSPVSHTNTLSLTSNLSFSLDKGLNELEGPRTFDWHEKTGSYPSLFEGPEIRPTDEVDASTFLKTWEADKHSVLFSDEDSDQNNFGMLLEKTVCRPEDKADIRVDGDRVSLGSEACDVVAETFTIKTDNEEMEAALGDVTDRTEALASQRSSFNMFRTRFPSAT